jgi:hypothetical protein
MTTLDGSSMTPAQAANFRILRRVIFGVAVVIFAFLLWRAMLPGGQISNMLQGSSLSKLDGSVRPFAVALSVLAGILFAWFASSNIAKVLARQVSSRMTAAPPRGRAAARTYASSEAVIREVVVAPPVRNLTRTLAGDAANRCTDRCTRRHSYRPATAPLFPIRSLTTASEWYKGNSAPTRRAARNRISLRSILFLRRRDGVPLDG